MPQTPIKRHPDALTAHLANGGTLNGSESAWAEQTLAYLRASAPGNARPEGDLSLADLKRIYTSARVVHGSIVSSRLALPATIYASEMTRALSLPDDLDHFADLGMSETERFLTGINDGKPRAGNDYPGIFKKYISALAGLLGGAYGRAYADLEEGRPDLLALACDMDEIQRLAWGQMRWIINIKMPTEEVACYRRMPLREATDALLEIIRERTGVSVPARVMQRDDWLTALERPRQGTYPAALNTMKVFVENVEIGLLYCTGSLLVRLALGRSPEDALRDHLSYGAQEIAAGTHGSTHTARFQSRIGARPNYYRSFEEFLRNVRKQTMRASIKPDGNLAWSDPEATRGWCPAQNKYQLRDGSALTGLAERVMRLSKLGKSTGGPDSV